jgi:Asp-tRNA(Asn)/Glu-tRNA(Gln) amidotransferase A subunit family amidase
MKVVKKLIRRQHSNPFDAPPATPVFETHWVLEKPDLESGSTAYSTADAVNAWRNRFLNAAQGRCGTLASEWTLVQEYDAILTPSASGEAPIGLDNTGDPSFCTIWTFCGVPALNIPVFQGENGMPIGTQLVGAKNDDARLLRTANWLLSKLND